MHGPMNVKSPNNTSKWQMEFNSAFKGLGDNSGDLCVDGEDDAQVNFTRTSWAGVESI
jgi:hypothetical protein